MTDFIKLQQELARNKMNIQAYRGQQEYFISEQGLDTLIAQIITNTGEELVRRVKMKHTREMQPGENRAKYLAFQRGEEHMRHKIIDTIKQHITSVTGATHEK